MMSPIATPSKVYKNGSMTSKIREEKESSSPFLPTKSISKIGISRNPKAKNLQKGIVSFSKKSVPKLVKTFNSFLNK